MSSKTGVTVAKATFPLYTIQSLSRSKFIIGGGGGTAKTGVPNAFEIYEMSRDNNEARKLVAVNTDDSVMSCVAVDASNKIYVSCTEGEAWRSYNLLLDKKAPSAASQKAEKQDEDKATNETNNEEESQLRERRKGDQNKKKVSEEAENTDDTEIGNADNILDLCTGWKVKLNVGKLMNCEFEIENDHFYHSILLFSKDHNAIVTGSSDGKIRIWPVSESVKCAMENTGLVEIEAHKGEINDLTLSRSGDRAVSLCRSVDEMILWSFPGLKKLATLTWSPANNIKYKVRAVKFAAVEGKRKHSRLFTLSNAAVRGNKLPSYLVKWDCPTFIPSKHVVTGKDDLCSLAVSNDGDYVAVGTLSGSVAVYIAFSLQKLYEVAEAHSTFVTGLTFLPQRADSKYDVSVVSVSADSRIKVYNVKKRLMVPFFLVVILFAACLFLAYFVLDIFNI